MLTMQRTGVLKNSSIRHAEYYNMIDVLDAEARIVAPVDMAADKPLGQMVADLREAFPNASMTTDMICGFPGETEEEHKESCAFAEEIGFTHIHVFPFSPREGTKAYSMQGQVDGGTKSRRTSQLREISDRMEESRTKDFQGKTVEVLVEEARSDGSFEGYCREYVRVRGKREGAVSGQILLGTVTGSDGFMLLGENFHPES